MSNNRYTLPGWLAISLAVLFPLNVVFGIVQSILGKKLLGIEGPMVGPSDLLSVLFTFLVIYVLYMFRRLLNEHYDFYSANIVIWAAIVWHVVFAIAGLVMKLLAVQLGPDFGMPTLIGFITLFVVAMTTGGLIDILLAVKLLRLKEKMNDPMKVFTYVTLAAGIVEVTVILSPLAMILFPIWCVTLGIVFLREKNTEQFL